MPFLKPLQLFVKAVKACWMVSHFYFEAGVYEFENDHVTAPPLLVFILLLGCGIKRTQKNYILIIGNESSMMASTIVTSQVVSAADRNKPKTKSAVCNMMKP